MFSIAIYFDINGFSNVRYLLIQFFLSLPDLRMVVHSDYELNIFDSERIAVEFDGLVT